MSPDLDHICFQAPIDSICDVTGWFIEDTSYFIYLSILSDPSPLFRLWSCISSVRKFQDQPLDILAFDPHGEAQSDIWRHPDLSNFYHDHFILYLTLSNHYHYPCSNLDSKTALDSSNENPYLIFWEMHFFIVHVLKVCFIWIYSTNNSKHIHSIGTISRDMLCQ